jgi:hypothetical protein
MRTPLPVNDLEGLPIARVFLDLRGRSGLEGGDAEARRQIERCLQISEAGAFGVQAAEAALQRLRGLLFVRQARYEVYESERAGYLVLAFRIDLGPLSETRQATRGVLAGQPRDFPLLHESATAQTRLLLDGGLGLYTDLNPWFAAPDAFARSPVALDPARGAQAVWFEATAEYGLATISRVGRWPLWLYGASTFLTSVSTGQDLFRDDTREMTRLEDLYGGLLLAAPEQDFSASLSAGRQNWQLNDGFLFSRFAAGANAGPYPALYLNPRTAYERTLLAKAEWRKWRLEVFFLDPAEIDFLDSNSTYAGLNLAWKSPGSVEASVVYCESPESDTVFPSGTGGGAPREGLRTLAPRLGTLALAGVKGWELFGEHAWQTHRDVDWEARAYYLRTGYTFATLPWKPNLSYSYAHFSGDDPGTTRYERFDAPLSSGLDTWVQGVSAKKVVTNANLNSHRLRLNLVPSRRLNVTADFFWLLADEPLVDGGLYAREVNLALRWTLSRNLFFLGVAGVAFPGDQLRAQASKDLEPWTTFQASLFWNF